MLIVTKCFGEIRNRITVNIERDSVFNVVRNTIPVESYNIRLRSLLDNVGLLTQKNSKHIILLSDILVVRLETE